jgi:hypothetical protein
MARDTARPRRPIRAERIRLLKLLGFRYSVTRDAYIMRVLGTRFGPVFRVLRQPRSTHSRALESMTLPDERSVSQEASTGQ